MRALTFAIIVGSLLSETLYGQQQAAVENEPLSVAAALRGSYVQYDNNGADASFANRMLTPAVVSQKKKNPFLAGILSLAIPGVGEVYAGNYLLAALFASLEGVGWYYSIDAHRRGDDATTVYQRYADQNWSVVKYAEWLNENAQNYPGGDKAVHIDIDPNETLLPWQRVNWEKMHETELAIPQFSHRLPNYGDQQYYELIGKYNQYSYGWNDKLDGDYWDPSANFLYYSGLRGDANRLYDKSSTIINLIIVNHFLSAIDAAWAAARFNNVIEFHAASRLQRLPDGTPDMLTTAEFSYRF